jgi:hypothetical protein
MYFTYEHNTLMCLKCVKAPQKTSIFTKWRVADIQELLIRVKNWRENKTSQDVPEVIGLCNGNFMGTVSYCYVLKGNVKPDNKLVIDTNINFSQGLTIGSVLEVPAKLPNICFNVKLESEDQI